jgi:hypothetical protein
MPMSNEQAREAREKRREENRRKFAEEKARRAEESVPFPLVGPLEVDLGTTEGLKALFVEAARGVERIVRAPLTDKTVTNRDRLEAFSALRQAAGVGKVVEAPAEYRLNVESLRGGSRLPPGGGNGAGGVSGSPGA